MTGSGESRLERNFFRSKAVRPVSASPTLPTETARPDPRRTSLGSGLFFFEQFQCTIVGVTPRRRALHSAFSHTGRESRIGASRSQFHE